MELRCHLDRRGLNTIRDVGRRGAACLSGVSRQVNAKQRIVFFSYSDVQGGISSMALDPVLLINGISSR
ncbi:hypothetical protein D1872_323450 [compost metagenome]